MSKKVLASLTLALGLHTAGAQAALVLGAQTLNVGGSNVTTGSLAVNVLSVPSATTFGDTLPGGLSNLLAPPASAANYNFYDHYLLSVPENTAAAVATSFSFGSLFNINLLQIRLYSGNTPTLGTPAGLMQGWSSPISAGAFSGTVTSLPETVLGAGSYVLEVRGLVTGSAGGLYSGQFTVAPAPVPAPVPVPAALWLMGSALGLVGAASRSRPQVKQA
jgi:hypothetical protein